jgi:hypothetical protein
VVRKKQSESEPGPQRQVALMLCESLLHELVENGVIAKIQALNIIDTVAELVSEAVESNRPLGSERSNPQTPSAMVIIEAIRKSFAIKGAS